jgi:hypothetical protein
MACNCRTDDQVKTDTLVCPERHSLKAFAGPWDYARSWDSWTFGSGADQAVFRLRWNFPIFKLRWPLYLFESPGQKRFD